MFFWVWIKTVSKYNFSNLQGRLTLQVVLFELAFNVPGRYDVELYFNERDLLHKDAARFYSFYQANNWTLSNNRSMKCWRSAARSWISKIKDIKLNKNQEL